MKIFFQLFGLLSLLITLSCSSDTVNLTTEEVFAIKTIDIGNNQNASDFLVTFKVNNPATIKEIRAFLIDPTEFPEFTSTQAANLPSTSYHKIAVNGTDYQVQLPASLKDVNGANIEEEIDYFIGFALLIEDDIALNTLIAEARLEEGHHLTGKYTGTWDDNIYTGFGISADLVLVGSSLAGPFWYSNNYTSCCGGQTDGRISLKLDDQQITSFIYNQTLASFMGGECNGTYNGTGKVENFTTLVIDFEGNDCEGPHIGGVIRLVKVQ